MQSLIIQQFIHKDHGYRISLALIEARDYSIRVKNTVFINCSEHAWIGFFFTWFFKKERQEKWVLMDIVVVQGTFSLAVLGRRVNKGLIVLLIFCMDRTHKIINLHESVQSW